MSTANKRLASQLTPAKEKSKSRKKDEGSEKEKVKENGCRGVQSEAGGAGGESSKTQVIVLQMERWERLEKSLDGMERLLERMDKRMESVEKKVKDLEEGLQFQSSMVEEMKKENLELRRVIEWKDVEAKIALDRHEQYSRRESIRVFGLEEKVGEDVEEMVLEVGRKVGINLQKRDVAACHRVGGGERGSRDRWCANS